MAAGGAAEPARGAAGVPPAAGHRHRHSSGEGHLGVEGGTGAHTAGVALGVLLGGSKISWGRLMSPGCAGGSDGRPSLGVILGRCLLSLGRLEG